jgi:hypothetical protein
VRPIHPLGDNLIVFSYRLDEKSLPNLQIFDIKRDFSPPLSSEV